MTSLWNLLQTNNFQNTLSSLKVCLHLFAGKQIYCLLELNGMEALELKGNLHLTPFTGQVCYSQQNK